MIIIAASAATPSSLVSPADTTTTPDTTLENNFLTVDFASIQIHPLNDKPSRNANLCMLDWLSRISFDEEELNELRQYFYDIHLTTHNHAPTPPHIPNHPIICNIIYAITPHLLTIIHHTHPIT